MKKQLLILCILFSTSIYGAQYKDYTTTFNEEVFGFYVTSLKQKNILAFARNATKDCSIYNSIGIHIFNVFNEPSLESKTRGENYTGEIRIDEGIGFPFSWVAGYPENSTKAVILINKDKGWLEQEKNLIRSMKTGKYVEITIFNNTGNGFERKYVDKFSLIGFDEASEASYNNCIRYNSN